MSLFRGCLQSVILVLDVTPISLTEEYFLTLTLALAPTLTLSQTQAPTLTLTRTLNISFEEIDKESCLKVVLQNHANLSFLCALYAERKKATLIKF